METIFQWIMGIWFGFMGLAVLFWLCEQIFTVYDRKVQNYFGRF